MTTEAARSAYLGDYAVMVNVVSFLCLLFGISNIQRRLGIKVSLVMMPFIVLAMVLSFKAYPVVHVLFWIMVVAKAINYALNGPALKTLYVPTSHDVKYKSQAWIETFGSRGSKAAGSGVNMLQEALYSKVWRRSWPYCLYRILFISFLWIDCCMALGCALSW